MTRYAYTAVVELTGTKEAPGETLTLYYDSGFSGTKLDELRQRGKALVLDGRTALWATFDALKRFPEIDEKHKNALKDAFRAFFALSQKELDEWDKVKGSKKPSHFNLITQVVTKTLNGLLGDQYLKVGKINALEGRITIGQITSKDAEQFETTKPYHNVVRELSSGKGGPAPKDAEHRRMGAIIISNRHFFSDDELEGGLIALIHEATHKYAGTQDEFYVTEEFMSHKNDPMFRGKSYAKAIVNADSYANLAAYVHRA
jgi:hypothetical protein